MYLSREGGGGTKNTGVDIVLFDEKIKKRVQRKFFETETFNLKCEI